MGGMRCGEQPKWSWKGVKPVDALMEFMILKWIFGSAWTQPFWFRRM
jgi:hypothetical protein